MPAAYRTVFMGSPEFAVPSLMALATAGYDLVAVYTQPDRPAGRGKKLVQPPVKPAAETLGVRILQPERLRGTEEIARLRELHPDLVIVAAYGQILRPAVFDLPAFGCLNVHASLLPRHRGASAIAAAILAGDEETGVSIMRIDAGLDTGPVIARRAIPIGPDDTTGSLTTHLAELGASLLVETLPAWLQVGAGAVPQDESQATYAPLLSKELAEIRWSGPALQIWREVRAYNPWPVSFTTLPGGETLQILEAIPVAAGAAEGRPGTVVQLPARGAGAEAVSTAAGFAVVCGDGLLVPLRVRRSGRAAVSAPDFLRGARDVVGHVLGRLEE